jgi:hypothetical protein
MWRLIMSMRVTVKGLKSRNACAIVTGVAFLLVVATLALAAQNRYTLKIPNGLAFAEFKGYENWPDVAVSETDTEIKVIVANPVMMNAFRSGLPSGGKLFPNGSKVAKIEWSFKKNTVSPYSVDVPDTLKTLAFIEKDARRFPETHGWAYASWDYDAATDTFKPAELDPSGAECGFACHTRVASQDYIFTAYPKR